MTTSLRGFLLYAWLAVATGLGGLAVADLHDAWRDRHEPNRLVIPLRVDRRSEAQLFYDAGRGINPTDAAGRTLWPTRALRDFHFSVPREPLRALRFDPLTGEGAVNLGAPRLESSSGRVLALVPLDAIKPQHQVAELRRDGEIVHVTNAPGATDPRLEIALAAPLQANPPPLRWGWIVAAIAAWSGVFFFAREMRDRVLALAQPAGAAGFWCGVFAIGGLQFWLLWGLHRGLDVPMWDEAAYMNWAASWSQAGSPGRHFSHCPLYVLQYVLEMNFGLDGGGAFFVHQYFFKTATTVLLYAVLARWWRCWPLAFLLALVWMNTAFQANQLIVVYHAAFFWLLLALLVADASPTVALGSLALGTCVRQEYQFAALAFAAWLGWKLLRRQMTWGDLLARRADRRMLATLAAAPLFGVFLFIVARVEMSGTAGRAWFTFQQHYAVRAVADGEVQGVEPWTNYPAIAGRDFPGAQSFFDALRINPSAVTHHLLSNLRRTPAALLDLVRPLASRRAPVLVGLLAFVALAWWWRGAEGKPGFELSPSIALAAGTLLALAPGLVIYAKDAYLLAALPLVLLVFSWATWRLVGLLPACRWRAAWLPLALVVVPLVATAIIRRPFAGTPPQRPMLENVAALDFHWPADRRLKLLAVPAASYQVYLGATRCAGIEGMLAVRGNTTGETTFAALLAQHQPDVVLITPEWTNSAAFDAAEAERLLRAPAWRAMPLSSGTAYFRAGLPK